MSTLSSSPSSDIDHDSYLSDHCLWSSLPGELIVEIIETGACISPRLAITLCSVSSWTRDLAIEGLRTIVLNTEDELSHFPSLVQLHRHLATELARDIDSGRPPRAPRFVTENIWWGKEIASFDMRSALRLRGAKSMMQNIVHFAARRELIPFFEFECGYMVRPYRLFHLGPDRAHTSRHASHIHVAPYQTDKTYHFHLLSSPPEPCTHIAIPFAGLEWKDMPTIPSAIKQFVLVFYDHELSQDVVAKWFATIRARDGRIYFATAELDTIQARWEEEVRGGESIWRRGVRETHRWQEDPDHMHTIREAWQQGWAGLSEGQLKSRFREAVDGVLASSL